MGFKLGKTLLRTAGKQLFGDLFKSATKVVQEVAFEDSLTSGQKRQKAQAILRAQAKETGAELKDSALNLLLELAVSAIK